MSSIGKTENYLLNQWEGSDTFQREDFNNDNLAIENALTALAANKPYVIGSYKGNGTTTGVTVDIGFKPQAILIGCNAQTAGQFMFLIRGITMTCKNNSTASGYAVKVTWSDNGISWAPDSTFGANISSASEIMNSNNVSYFYIAFK